jgi:catechol 2,3-dioxygenase-like lactoylglutathione lyase family enzyme
VLWEELARPALSVKTCRGIRNRPHMKLAKPRVDIGLNTNTLEPMLAFWQNEVGAKFDHVLPIQSGVRQHRHDLGGSVLKINHYRDPLHERPPSGYLEVLVAREGLSAPKSMIDPDGNRVSLVPSGVNAITQIAIRLGVRDLDAHTRFFRDALGLEAVPFAGGAGFRAAETLILCEQSSDAPADAAFDGKGWRYMTFQVFKVDEEHASVRAHGGREALAPRTLGTTARISMVRDPDGNWIELSQRASITGTLEP